jgi:hypothetical protein
MTRDDIIRMARDASNNASGLYEEDSDLVILYFDELERFAALVAASEREACARAASIALLGADKSLSYRVLNAIRSRGKHE